MSAGRPKGVRKCGWRTYEIAGATCQCGCQLLAQASGRRGEFEWELYCVKCLCADPDGYATLRECAEATQKETQNV